MFGRSKTSRFSFECTAHTEASNRLLFVVEQGEPFVALMAAAGSGKSRVLSNVRDECSRNGMSAVLVKCAALDEISLLGRIAAGLSISVDNRATRPTLMTLIRDELAGRFVCGRQTIVLLDDFQKSSDDLSGVIQFLSAVNEQTDGSICVIAGCDGVLPPGLASLSALRVQLQPLAEADAQRFTEELLGELGVNSGLVNEDAYKRIITFGCGYPARLTRICELAALAVEASPGLQLDSQIIDELTGETLLSRAG